MKQTLTPLLKRILLQVLMLLCCYFISRCVFTALNINYFPGITFLHFLQLAFYSIRYDISTIAITNAFYFLLLLLPIPIWRWPKWEKITQIIFIALNAIALIFECSDWTYFPYNLKRANSGILDLISRKGDFWSLLPGFLKDFWYVPAAWLLMVYILIQLNKRITKLTPLKKPVHYSIKIILSQLLILILFSGLSVVGFRGGLQYIPINITNAVQVTEPVYTPIVINTPFSIITTIEHKELTELNYFPNAQLQQYFNTTKHFNGGKNKGKNVVIIIVESFSKEFSKLGNKKSYTPFLDSLMDHTFTCTNAYANALHSQEAIPAIISGLPYLMDDPIQNSVYATNNINSLPSLLKSKGYSSAFYHGGTNGTMSFDVYCASAGFDQYNGRTEYGNDDDYDGNWGIWDEPFLQFFATDINRLKQPFCASVFTLSSHEPFHIPNQYNGKFPTGDLPIYQAMAYTDFALRSFFKTAATQPWYNNTLFVITADHHFPYHSEQFTHNMDAYAIPIVYYAPADTLLKGYSNLLTQEIDILPSVLDYLGYDQPFFAFGNSVFQKNAHRYTINCLSDQYQFYSNDYLLQSIGMKPSALYHIPPDTLCKDDLLIKAPQQTNIQLSYLKAFLQLYNSALINNKMSITPNK